MNSFLSFANELPEGHPVRVYYDEAQMIQGLIQELRAVSPDEDFQKYYNVFNEFATIEKRFVRKENQLFPYLEKHGWDGPSQGMWSFHDNLRDNIRNINRFNQERNIDGINQELSILLSEVERLMMIEDMRLFPNAMNLLTEQEWKEFYEGDEEIGWMLKQKPVRYPAETDAYVHPSQDFDSKSDTIDKNNTFHLDEGFMTPEQVNMMLQHMPVDLTYVDENDRVIFYNRGEERVFPRSKGVIGREVRFCHPPKSVDMVLRIVEEFRSGTKDTAEFWINYRGRMVHIRYFAIRDKEKRYRGVIEMSQDVTEIQKLEGQKRLLDWD